MTPRDVLVPPAVACLQPLVDIGAFSPVEVHFAAWVQRAGAVDDPLVLLAAASAVWATRHGHVCADLDELPVAVARAVAADADELADVSPGVAPSPIEWPEPAAWVDAIRGAAQVVREVQFPDPVEVFDPRPLVLHGRRVYLQRHWLDECLVAASLRARSALHGPDLDAGAGGLLDALLPAESDGVPNLQRRAADTVVAHPLAVVVGGPGTGKTYSVARLLAVLTDQALAEGRHLRVALAAPTGKAAARLHESITAALLQTDLQAHVSPEVRATLAAVVPTTIHRLLGPMGGRRQRFRHDHATPLPHDVVVVDETSMVSLPLLARLVDAVRPDARLVLLGDPDQLESVELGAVLADIVDGSAGGPLASRVVRLLRGHRFEGGSAIARFADAVREGDAAAAVALLHEPSGTANAASEVKSEVQSEVQFVDTEDRLDPTEEPVLSQVRSVVEQVLHGVRLAAEAGNAAEALRLAASIRILCGHRQGPFGVAEWNRRCTQWTNPDAPGPNPWYAGRLLLVTRNDPRLGLSNGDTGVVVRRDGRLMAAFGSPTQPVEFDPAQLDAVDTAFAITVHKSQGSEYETVVLVLPPARSPLAGRELVYTGATRAKHRLVVVGGDDALRAAVARPATRMTGLGEALSAP